MIESAIHGFQKQKFSVEELHKEIKLIFGKELLLLIIERELKSYAKRGIIEALSPTEYKILKETDSYITQRNESSNSVDFFFRDLKRFINENKEYKLYAQHRTIVDRLKQYCNEQFFQIAPYVAGETKSLDLPKSDDPFHKLFSDYIESEVVKNPAIYKGFARIFHGSTLLNIIEHCATLPEKESLSLNNKVFYIDTNILLRILHLQDEYLNKLGDELFSLLKENNVQIRIFDSTREEFEALIRGYKYATSFMIPGRNVSHVYQVLCDAGYLKSDIPDLIESYRAQISSLGIEVDPIIELNELDYPLIDKFSNELAKVKKRKKENKDDSETIVYDPKFVAQAYHDIHCLFRIRFLRKKYADDTNRWETTKHYFITADGATLKFNKRIHEVPNTGQLESISDTAIAFLLYLGNPQSSRDISTESFIIAHFSTANLSIDNWLKYVRRAYKKYDNGDITKTSLGHLLTQTALGDEKINSSSIDSVIDNSIEEFTRMNLEVEELKNQTLEIKKKNEALLDSNNKAVDRLNITTAEKKELEQKIDSIGQEYGDFKEEQEKINLKTKNQVTDLSLQIELHKKSFRVIRISIGILFSVLLIIGIALIVNSNLLSGGIVAGISVIIQILNLIDYFQKWVLKD
ncbi:hypothetical protein CH370_18795 [Leptospira kmetyi]|nr:hypothetical protein CH370_18795 [Leptospira kmetyi]